MSIRIVPPHQPNRHGLALGLILSTLPVLLAAQPPQPACPYAKSRSSAPTAAAPASPDDPSCLIAPGAAPPSAKVIDVRPAGEYARFHIPGAENISVLQLLSARGRMPQDFVAYDDGRFRNDAIQLCARLRKAGYAQVKVIDGGIAAWAQSRRETAAMTLSRLSDGEIAAAILGTDSQVIALSPSLQGVLKSHDITSAGRAGNRRLVLADTTTATQKINAQLMTQGKLALYWIGEAEELHRLLDQQIAMEAKRQAGPAESTVCSAL